MLKTDYRKKFKKFINLLINKYPEIAIIRNVPRIIHERYDSSNLTKDGVIAVQIVEDSFYATLFAVLTSEISNSFNLRSHGVVIRATSADVGFGWTSIIQRSILINYLATRQWENFNRKIINSVGLRAKSWSDIVRTFLLKNDALIFWEKIKSNPSEVNNLKICGITVGDLIIDSYLRFRPAGRFNAEDPFVLELIIQTYIYIAKSFAYFKKNRPKIYITSYSTYIEHGVPVRVALTLGIPVYSFGSLNQVEKKLSLDDWFHTLSGGDYRNTFSKLDDQNDRLIEAEKLISIRFGGDIDGATAYMKKSAYAFSSETTPTDMNNSVVIFLHDFFDSPHIYPRIVFNDFWEWVIFTVNTLKAARINYFLKPHPNQIDESGKILKDLIKLHPDIKVLSPKITNTQLVRAGIKCGITVYGTVAHELAYFGIPSISCSDNPHLGYDFSLNATSRESYATLLRNCTKIGANKNELKRQALEFIYMRNLYGKPQEISFRKKYVDMWRSARVTQSPQIFEEMICNLIDDGFFKILANKLMHEYK